MGRGRGRGEIFLLYKPEQKIITSFVCGRLLTTVEKMAFERVITDLLNRIVKRPNTPTGQARYAECRLILERYFEKKATDGGHFSGCVETADVVDTCQCHKGVKYPHSVVCDLMKVLNPGKKPKSQENRVSDA